MSDSTVIEIGPRDMPLVSELRLDLIPPNATFLYVDSEKAWMSKLKKAVGEGGEVLQGDATRLPVAAESADTIFIKDVFGHLGTPEYVPGRGFTGRVIGTKDSAQRIANEMARVLKSGGKAVILETITPYNQGKLVREFKNAGFTEENIKIYDVERIHEIYKDKKIGKAFFIAADLESYVVVFEK